MKTLIALLLMTAAASAQTSWTSPTGTSTVSTCTALGETWKELGTTCHADKLMRVTPEMWTGADSTTWASAPKCPSGYSLVYTGRPMCARELIEPQ